jgi:hypothetical protein
MSNETASFLLLCVRIPLPLWEPFHYLVHDIGSLFYHYLRHVTSDANFEDGRDDGRARME